MPFDGTTFVELDEVTRVLKDARDIIEKGGWCRGQQRDERGRHCVIGAISVAIRKDGDPPRAKVGFFSYQQHKLYRKVIDRFVTTALKGGNVIVSEGTVTNWNDGIARSKKQVLAKFDKAIAEERAE